ncbi:hypothetical protein Brms1b_013266, partial [Colletotrichum noveboracense]
AVMAKGLTAAWPASSAHWMATRTGRPAKPPGQKKGFTFVHLRRLLRNKRPVMESAVELASVNPKSKKKPKLCYHLKIALDRVANRQLQQRVLDFARHHADAFRAPEDHALTASDITLVNEPAYGRRFDHAAWARLLRIVQQVTDAGDEDDRVLWPSWRASHVTNEGVRREQVSTLVTAFCSTLPRLGTHTGDGDDGHDKEDEDECEDDEDGNSSRPRQQQAVQLETSTLSAKIGPPSSEQ